MGRGIVNFLPMKTQQTLEPAALVNLLRGYGVEVKRTKKGHYLVRSPNGVDTAMIPSTPSDYRSMQNAMADLERIGLGLDRLKAQHERREEKRRERAAEREKIKLEQASQRAKAQEETMTTNKPDLLERPKNLPMQDIVYEILEDFGEEGSTFWPIVARVEEVVAERYVPGEAIHDGSVRSAVTAVAVKQGKTFDDIAGRKVWHYYLPQFLEDDDLGFPEPPEGVELGEISPEEAVKAVKAGRADLPVFDTFEVKESSLEGRHVRVTLTAEMDLDNYAQFLDWMEGVL
jgi:hypothetical protein